MTEKQEKAIFNIESLGDMKLLYEESFKEDVSYKIGEAIKALRKANGFTQQEMANRLGYGSKTTINKIEKNINGVSLEKLYKISEYFGIPVQWILDASGIEETIIQQGHLIRKNEDFRAIEQTMMSLNPSQLKQLRSMCDLMYPMPKTAIENSKKLEGNIVVPEQ